MLPEYFRTNTNLTTKEVRIQMIDLKSNFKNGKKNSTAASVINMKKNKRVQLSI